jgi:hypothetical protein
MQRDVRVLSVVDLKFLYCGGCKGEEAKVDVPFMRNISDHSGFASGPARNEVGEP